MHICVALPSFRGLESFLLVYFLELNILLDSFPMMKIYLNFRHADILTAKVDI